MSTVRVVIACAVVMHAALTPRVAVAPPPPLPEGAGVNVQGGAFPSNFLDLCGVVIAHKKCIPSATEPGDASATPLHPDEISKKVAEPGRPHLTLVTPLPLGEGSGERAVHAHIARVEADGAPFAKGGGGTQRRPESPPRILASVYAWRTYTVGARNPITGLFALASSDTTWMHQGAPNTKTWCTVPLPGTSGSTLLMGAGDGVHRSTDAGATWRTTTDWRVADALCMAVDPKLPSHVIIGTATGIIQSLDGGMNCMPANRGLTGTFVSALAADRNLGNHWLLGTNRGIERSTNGGRAWTRTNLRDMEVKVIAQDPSIPRRFLAGIEDHGIWISDDGGSTWHQTGASDTATVYALAFDPLHPHIVFAGGFASGVRLSRDGGRTWGATPEILRGVTVHGIAVSRNGELIAAATIERGVFLSTDGGTTWRQAGLDGARVWSVTIEEDE